jgi:hypothetical protein
MPDQAPVRGRGRVRVSSWAGMGMVAALAAGAAACASGTASPAAAASGTPAVAIVGAAAGGTSCVPRPGSAVLTLTDTSPAPAVTVPVGATLVVMVPPWHVGKATDVHIDKTGILSHTCSVLLSNHGRRAVLRARRPGETGVFATVTPAGQAGMPAWLGKVTVAAAVSPGG